jgi:DnaJ-class molecular chaperone
MAASTTRDYYQVLGVPRTASDKDIRSAYRRLARKYHPDLNPGDKAAEARFKELQAAYDVLSDETKRKKYDQFGPNWESFERAQGASGFGGFSGRSSGRPPFDFGEGGGGDFSDIFENLFGGLGGSGSRNRAGTRTRVQPGQDIEHAVEVSLDEAYHGTTRIVEFTSRTSGSARRLEVKVPVGIKTGGRIRIAGEGEAGVGGGVPGDLYLIVTVRTHGAFERKDDDLTSEVAVPLTTAVLGGEVPVPTLKGKAVHLRIPAETQNGQTFRMTGLGMPKTGGTFGDLYVRAKIVLPTRLTPAERQLFEELQRLRGA